MEIVKIPVIKVDDKKDKAVDDYFSKQPKKKTKVIYKDGKPCNHLGCVNHISHPCEGCGRIGAKGEVKDGTKI